MKADIKRDDYGHSGFDKLEVSNLRPPSWQILLGSMESDGFQTLNLTVYYSLLDLESTS